MQEEQKRFHLLDALFEPIVVVDAMFEIVYYNHFFSTFFRASPRIIKKAKNLFEIVKIGKHLLNELVISAKNNNQVALSKEMEIKMPSLQNVNDAEEANHAVIKIIPLEGESLFIVCFNVISVEKNLHEKYRIKLNELKSAHGQIIQADKLAMLGELSASIAHEINNPLAIAMGNGEIVEQILANETNLQDRDLINKSYANILESLHRIKSIVANMKSFSHKSEEKKQYNDLVSIIDKSLLLVDAPIRSNGINIKFDRTSEKFIILSNRIEMEQVMVNLLKNSLDAIRSMKKQRPGKVEIQIKKNSATECMEIWVIDNGPGIPTDIQKEVFSPFFTTKEFSEGTGLGLSVSTKIIERHHGKIFIQHSDEHGTTFVIQLPLLEISSYISSENILSTTNDENKKKILVVDDDEQILNVMSTFLEEDGHSMIGSTDPDEALEMMDKLQMDVIITDYNMPKMDGSSFSEKVRKKNANIPIVYLTSADFIKYFKEDQKKHNVVSLILKPFSKDDVAMTIKEILKDRKIKK